MLLTTAACAGRIHSRQPPAAPARRDLVFTATAYCQRGLTAAGTKVRAGVVAADPDVLPIGSVIRVVGLKDGRDGVYTVMDTGTKVHGRHIDVYVGDCRQAVRFGRQSVRVIVGAAPSR